MQDSNLRRPQGPADLQSAGFAAHTNRAFNFYSADDQIRTGRLNVGNVALYQMSYIRIVPSEGIEPPSPALRKQCLTNRPRRRRSPGIRTLHDGGFGVHPVYPSTRDLCDPLGQGASSAPKTKRAGRVSSAGPLEIPFSGVFPLGAGILPIKIGRATGEHDLGRRPLMAQIGLRRGAFALGGFGWLRHLGSRQHDSILNSRDRGFQ